MEDHFLTRKMKNIFLQLCIWSELTALAHRLIQRKYTVNGLCISKWIKGIEFYEYMKYIRSLDVVKIE